MTTVRHKKFTSRLCLFAGNQCCSMSNQTHSVHICQRVSVERFVYSFDYAQQIHIPSSSQQVGPIYFLTPYKVVLFGVACEPANKMVIYLVPECPARGKGANSVISYLHHFFDNFTFGEEEVWLRADNCTGQNKNHKMIAYLCYWVYAGLHRKITIAFWLVGHTKFYPDMGFRVFKRRFKVPDVSTLTDSAQCVHDSNPKANMLFPQLIGNGNGNVQLAGKIWEM